MASVTSWLKNQWSRTSVIETRIFLSFLPTYFPRDNQHPVNLAFSVTPSQYTRYRNINLLSIDYTFRSRLRNRLTLRRLTLRRNPWVFGVQVFHPHYRYSCQHSHFWYLQHASQHTFIGLQNAPLPRLSKDKHSQLRYTILAPLNLPRKSTWPVSCYAFFKGWLLLSQPPGCLWLLTSFPT